MLRISTKELILVLLSCVLVLGGILLNGRFIETRFALDADVSTYVSAGLSPLVSNVIRIGELILIIMGLVVFLLRKRLARALTLRNGIIMLAGIVVGGFLLEEGSYLALRYVLKAPVGFARGDTIGDDVLYIFTDPQNGLPYGVKKNFQQDHISREGTATYFTTTVRTNNVGMRENQDYHGEPVDIGVIGDSMAFGMGVNYGERFSDRLREYYPDKLILSYGFLDGVAPPHYYLFLKNHPELIPKTLIMTMYPENDMDLDARDLYIAKDRSGEPTAMRFQLREVRESGSLGVNYDGVHVKTIRRFLNKTYIGKLVWYSWQQAVAKYGGKNKATGASSWFLPIAQAHMLDSTQSTADGEPYVFDDNAKLVLGYVEKISELVKPKGTRFIVVMAPMFRAVRSGRGSTYDPRWEPIKQWLKNHQVEFVDPFKALEAREKSGKLMYIFSDEHWTKEGHQIVAEEIYKYLGADL